ncbi:hypothetical protein BV898_02091 [Hypsibius exemplaris]|uniref:Uncharacterized protein n=1 Tax=Hypsibius exemplaris TaxID=2072580 RepID=A0A1W0XA49_HYPEX|nr:hypothetical protein BV898_02091 [Hypsibius exemplaris]
MAPLPPTTLRVALLLAVLTWKASSASKVQFINRCQGILRVVQTGNGRSPFQLGDIPEGWSRTYSFDGGSVNFKICWKSSFLSIAWLGGKGITLAEFTFNGWNGLDFYNLSLVDGYNLPMQIVR